MIGLARLHAARAARLLLHLLVRLEVVRLRGTSPTSRSRVQSRQVHAARAARLLLHLLVRVQSARAFAAAALISILIDIALQVQSQQLSTDS